MHVQSDLHEVVLAHFVFTSSAGSYEEVMAEFLPAISPSLNRTNESTPSGSRGLPGRGSVGTLPRLYMTGDLRAVTGLSRTQLDYYLRDGLVKPTARTESGFLLFDDAEVELVQQIVSERRSGVALKDIRRRIGR